MSGISVTSVSVPASSSMLAQVSARPSKVAGDSAPQVAGQGKDALEVKQRDRPDMLSQLKAIEAQSAVRARAPNNVNTPDMPDNKKLAVLAMKVQAQQKSDLNREQQIIDYKAAAYSPHGFKGAYVDTAA